MSDRGSPVGEADVLESPMSQFEMGREIGKGQFSQVFLATHHPSKQLVAIKRIHLFGMLDSKARSDCLREVDLLKELKHENVVRYLGSHQDGGPSGNLLIVLELADAGDLAKFLASCQRTARLISETAIWDLFVQIASGLEHIHSKGIMHRDVKPANVFLTKDMTVKLGDLGLGRFFTSQTLAVHSLVGTPYYMSPERLNQLGYDFSSDIWSLGCLLYEMAALQPPFNCFKMNFNALRLSIERCQYPPLPSDTYSDDLRHVINRCLQRMPTDRPSAGQVLDAAKEALERRRLMPASAIARSPTPQRTNGRLGAASGPSCDE